MQSPAEGFFRSSDPVRMPNDPPLPNGESDEVNVGLSVLAVDIPVGTHTVAMIFSPVWNSTWDAVLPPLVSLDSWTLHSHRI